MSEANLDPMQGLPAQPETSETTDTKKPWYKRWWVWVIVAIVIMAWLASLGANDKNDPSDTAAQSDAASVRENPQSLGDAPNQVGQLLSVAEANLQLENFTVESVADSGKVIIDKGNWTVIEQKQNGDTVLLTVSKTEDDTPSTNSDTPSDGGADSDEATSSTQTTTGGLTALTAQVTCDRAAEIAFPYGVKMHWVVGKLAERYNAETDDWFFKVEATVTNEYGAKMKGVNVECYVTGSEDNPEVTDFLYY